MAGPRILLAHGARATEELVAVRVAELRDAARRDLSLLARPVRVIVPSVSLRDHLSTVLVRRCGALAGVQVATLFSAALELIRSSGRRPPRGTALFDVLVRRFARLEAPLRDRLEGLVEGYAVVSATVRDFFDAGFEPVHREGLDELLDTDAGATATGDEIARARSLLNVTAAAQMALDELGCTHRSALLREARDVLEEGGPGLWPTRELLVHGFADATGVVTDLLESLLRALDGTLYLDRPPAGAGGFELAHTERLAVRLSQVARIEAAKEAGGGAAGPAASCFEAPDPDAEMREIARRIRRLLDGGVRPEAVGLVARDLRGHGVVVRRHFRALGIPFSAGRAPGPLGRAGRDLAVLREVLRRGPSLSLERWLDGLRRLPGSEVELGPSLSSDLRLAFFALGASRLEDLPRLDVHGDTALKVDRDVLVAARDAGIALGRRLEAWAAAGSPSFGRHVETLLRVLDTHLGWSPAFEARAVVDAALEGLDVPPELSLSYDELVLVLLAAFEGRASEPLGGRGGGVRVLGVMEARGLTFEHLFLFAANRDVFPRPVTEDALLPDRLRRGLVRLLPDLPVKAAGYDEERYLFAQLLSSAPSVTVSWPVEDASGKALAPSPLLRRRPEDAAVEHAAVERAPRLLDPGAGAARPVEEELLVSAVHSDRRTFAEILPLALEETAGDVPVAALARARLAVLEELDPDRRRREGRLRGRRLGPYFGFLGSPSGTADPRRGDVFVTALENLAVCPWQTFLRRLLRVAPMPDPLASLPTLRGLLVGNLVHRVLERIAIRSLGGRFRRRGAPVAWPEAQDLETLLAEEAERVLREQGLGLRGLARAAVELARPYLETARRIDGTAGRTPIVRGAEVTETLAAGDGEPRGRRVRFKADRVDGDERSLLYTDYKTGALRRTRQDLRQDLLARVTSGEWLQATAYAYGRDRSGAAGRYVFLRPDLDDGDRELRVEAGDADLRHAFERALSTLLDAWDRGLFFPRLVEPDDDLEPPRCGSCRVAEACLRRDSGARGRLRRWAEARNEEAERGARSEAADAFLNVWWLRGARQSPS